MPESIGNVHDDFLRNVLKTGVGESIGRHRPGFTVKNKNIQRVEIYLKITSFTDGLVFAGYITPVRRADSYAICSPDWQIQECSAKVIEHFEWKESALPNILSISTPSLKHFKNIWNIDSGDSNFACINDHGSKEVIELYPLKSSQVQLNICKFFQCPLTF